jgi:hypothetical protein
VVVAGPDGSGKSSLCDALIGGALDGLPVMRLHHRPGVAPYRTVADGPVTDPHAQSPYGAVLSALKGLYVFGDFLIGWTLRFRPFVRRGGWVVLERGWWDLWVDPTRYRLRRQPKLIQSLGGRLPEPDITVVLEGPTELLLSRKQELAADELIRQMRAWRSLSQNSEARFLYLDASRPLAELARAVERELVRTRKNEPARRRPPRPVRPPGASPGRWLIPRAPRKASMSGLRVYYPVTAKAQLGWGVTLAGAAMGAFRLLPGQDLPKDIDRVLSHVPSGGAVALARSNHPGRYVALILGERGEPLTAAKIAADVAGREALERERHALAALGHFLPSPVSPPTVVHYEEGFLLMRAVRWRLRPAPWRLPQDVATAMGTLHRAGFRGSAEGPGISHGDFAPWNLMRTDGGWVLLDWEEAGAGPPFFDLFHYLVQAHSLIGHPSQRALAEGLQGRGWIGKSIRAYANGAGMGGRDVLPWFRLYLAESGRRLSPQRPDHRSALRARSGLWTAVSGG